MKHRVKNESIMTQPFAPGAVTDPMKISRWLYDAIVEREPDFYVDPSLIAEDRKEGSK